MAQPVFVMGLDLGQAQDFTAAVIVQAEGTQYDARLAGLPLVTCDVRYIERYDLGTPYQDIAADIGKRLVKIPKPRWLVVDETGVGRPVLEMIDKEMFAARESLPHGITIVGNGQPTLTDNRHAHVPKRDLVSSAQVALQNKVLRIARSLKHADMLVKELLAFRAKISDSGHDTYSAWRERDHDDLVLACSMAVWFAREVIGAMAKAEMKRRADLAAPHVNDYQISVI